MNTTMKKFIVRIETDYKPIVLISFSSNAKNAKLKVCKYVRKAYPKREIKRIIIVSEEEIKENKR